MMGSSKIRVSQAAVDVLSAAADLGSGGEQLLDLGGADMGATTIELVEVMPVELKTGGGGDEALEALGLDAQNLGRVERLSSRKFTPEFDAPIDPRLVDADRRVFVLALVRIGVELVDDLPALLGDALELQQRPSRATQSSFVRGELGGKAGSPREFRLPVCLRRVDGSQIPRQLDRDLTT